MYVRDKHEVQVIVIVLWVLLGDGLDELFIDNLKGSSISTTKELVS